jgi:raffinose/stachyose/melibiose transport system substrate-binding protein
MKRVCVLLSVLLILSGSFLFAGGGRQGSSTVTLSVWGDPDNQAVLEPVFTEINAAFEAKYPNIKLDYNYSGSFDGVNVALQSDSLPDLFWVQGNKSSKMAEMARAGFLLPFDQFNPDKSRFPPASVEYSLVDGKTYCTYPCFIDYVVVYYNADIFSRLGIAKPATYQDFEDAIVKLLAAGIVPISLGGADEWHRYWPVQASAASLSDDELERIKGGDKTGNYPKILQVLDDFRRYCQAGYFGSNPGGQDGDGARLSFSNGRAAMVFDGTWSSNIMKEVPFKLGSFAMPGRDGVRAAQSGYSNFNTYAVASKTKHPQEAFLYADFLGSQQAQQIMANHLASIPAISDIKVSDPMVAVFSEFTKVGNNIYHVLSNIDTKGRPQDIFHANVLPALMTGSMTAEEGLAAIVAEMKK